MKFARGPSHLLRLITYRSSISVRRDRRFFIFMRMQSSLKIFSAVFIVILSLLQAQPLLFDFSCERGGTKTAGYGKTACVQKRARTCSKTACDRPVKEPEEKKDCANRGCNPFVPCSIGFCCYLVENFISYTAASSLVKQKLSSFNDNRTSGCLSECWHPPEPGIHS